MLAGTASMNKAGLWSQFLSPMLAVLRSKFPITVEDVQRARQILLGTQGISSRDALHLAIMEAHEVSTILSFDRGFDGYPGVSRLGSL